MLPKNTKFKNTYPWNRPGDDDRLLTDRAWFESKCGCMKRKDANYKQCHLQKGETHHMAWIPEQFAVVGKFVKIKNNDGSWNDGWQVKAASEGVQSASDADRLSQVHKKTRRASDI